VGGEARVCDPGASQICAASNLNHGGTSDGIDPQWPIRFLFAGGSIGGRAAEVPAGGPTIGRRITCYPDDIIRLSWLSRFATLECGVLPPESEWFFITGCQRSGTTMLRLILECHSQISCFDELRSYQLLSTRSHEGSLHKPLVGFKVPRFAEQLDYSEPYDLGLTETFSRFYTGQNVVFIVRDVRDVVASMLRLHGTRSWLEEWAIPIIEDKLQREREFARRWADEFAICREARSLAAYGALYWSYKNDALIRYARARYPVLPVRYERLVCTPEPPLRRVCEWLGVPFEASLLDHPSHEHGELFEGGLTIGNTDSKRAIDSASVGQWKAWLTERDLRLIASIADPTQATLTKLMAASSDARPATRTSAHVE